jgi:hypothetical protein
VFLFFINSSLKKCNNFCQILTQELDFVIGTRPDTKLCWILDQELKALPGTRTSSSGTKLSTLSRCYYAFIYYRPFSKILQYQLTADKHIRIQYAI